MVARVSLIVTVTVIISITLALDTMSLDGSTTQDITEPIHSRTDIISPMAGDEQEHPAKLDFAALFDSARSPEPA